PQTYYPYIYNARRRGPRHHRAEMMTDLLDSAKKVTLEQAIDIAFSPEIYHAELWQGRLKQARAKAITVPPGGSPKDPERRPGLSDDATEVYELIQKWNRRSDAESEGALAYYAFKKSLKPEFARQVEVPSDITDYVLNYSVQMARE